MSDLGTIMNLLIRRLEKKVCALWYGSFGTVEDVGTGAFVSVNDKLLIATCAHVAKPFFAASEGYVVIPNGQSLPKSACTLLYADSGLDLALLEVSTSAFTVESFSTSDFAFTPDMALHDFSGTSILVCGFPAEKVALAATRRTMSPIIYLTGLDPAHPATQQRFSCLYPTGADEVIGESGLSTLPKPPGLSGGLVFTVPTTSGPKDKLWTLEGMRIVGVAVESNLRSYLEAASVYPLHGEFAKI